MLARHPWVFSGAVERVEGAPRDGDTVEIVSADGRFLGRGYYNSRSQIRVRVWTLEDEAVDRQLLARRLAAARRSRERVGLRFGGDGATTAFRLVNAEADRIPGLIVDAYGRFLVVQLLTAGIDQLRGELCELLIAELAPEGIWERSDVDVREKEGLEQRRGSLHGAEPPARLEVRESGLRYLVDLHAGQKTGFYLDQRESRRRVAEHVRALAEHDGGGALEVLNAFSYSGGFGLAIAAAHPRARIVNLDASSDALELARASFELAGLADRQGDPICGDAFQELRKLRDVGRAFDLIVLDPPKFAHAKSQVVAACRGYKDLNLLACKLLRPGGILATFSCSGLVGHELFQKVVFDGAHDAGRYATVIARLGPGLDHPSLLSFPEGDYLKGLLLELR